MTEITAPAGAPSVAAAEAPAAKPAGLKAKASDVGLKAYLKAPPPAQNAMLQGYLKAQPVAAKVSPHAKKVLGGAVAVLLLRKVRRRER